MTSARGLSGSLFARGLFFEKKKETNMWAFLLCESCPRLKGINTSQDQVQVTNPGATVAVVSFGSLQVISFLAKVAEIYPGSRRLVKGHQLQPGNVLGPRSKSLPGPWTTSLCLKGVESESDDISIQKVPLRCGACRQSTSTPEKSQAADLCQSLRRRKTTLFRWGETSH